MDTATEIKKILATAFAEDIGAGDVTSNAIIPADATGKFVFRAREEIVFCGSEAVKEGFRHPVTRPQDLLKDPAIKSQDDVLVRMAAKDGERLSAGATIAEISGNVREILLKERTVLNLLQHLSGIATETAKYVEALRGTKAKILDTRKTIPGLRVLEKYAVKCGGGENHRMGLFDMVLIKDNHIRATGGIAAAVEKVRKYITAHPALDAGSFRETPDQVRGVLVEVECDSLEQVREALAAKPDIILADNMTPEQLREVVKLAAGKIQIEASGNVNLQNLHAIAETGVDFISTSKITISTRAVDIALDEVV